MKTQIQRGRAYRRALQGTFALVSVGVCWTLAGCQTIELTRPALNGMLTGRVSTKNAALDPVVVVALDGATGKVVNRAFLEAERNYALPVPAGEYRLFAFGDQDRDGRRGRDEPVSSLYLVATPVRAHDRIELPTLEIRSLGQP